MIISCKSKEKPIDRIFRFVDGQWVQSGHQVTIPATIIIIGGTKCTIETDVVQSKLPLLLSKNSLKKAQTVLDMHSDTAQMFGQPVQLFQTSSGHYCVNLLNNDRESQFLANQVSRTQDLDMPFRTQLCAEQETLESEVLQVIELSDKDKQRKELIKILQQFGHATADKLQFSW